MLDQPTPVRSEEPEVVPDKAPTPSVPSPREIEERGKETNRQRNARKEKLGQATFSLKWDRDCGAEKAPTGLASSSTLASRTEPRGKGQGGKGGGKGGNQASVKDRTKDKRKLDQSASFLGGRWKSEEEMHMRDNFDS